MINKLLLSALLLPFLSSDKTAPATFEQVHFKAADGLEITADLYAPHTDPHTPFIVLFHQASWSRGAYREIAPRLNATGFNCLAVDQRSGGEVNNIENETHARAAAQDLGTTYVDAMADIEAAVNHAREHHAKGKLLVWGSSYSASLVLKLAGDHPENIDGVLSFAPGEYFASLGKPEDWVARSARNIEAPVFITSAGNERENWWSIWQAIDSETKSHYLPETPGNHGSRALWSRFDDSAGYWHAVREFLEPFQEVSTQGGQGSREVKP